MRNKRYKWKQPDQRFLHIFYEQKLNRTAKTIKAKTIKTKGTSAILSDLLYSVRIVTEKYEQMRKNQTKAIKSKSNTGNWQGIPRRQNDWTTGTDRRGRAAGRVSLRLCLFSCHFRLSCLPFAGELCRNVCRKNGQRVCRRVW